GLAGAPIPDGLHDRGERAAPRRTAGRWGAGGGVRVAVGVRRAHDRLDRLRRVLLPSPARRSRDPYAERWVPGGVAAPADRVVEGARGWRAVLGQPRPDTRG